MDVGQEPSKWHRSLSIPSPTDSATKQWTGLPHQGQYLRLPILQHNMHTSQKNMPQMKEQIKAPKTELNDKESQPIRCRVQNSGNQDAQRIG